MMRRFKGVFTALTTPFRSGKVDFKAFERQIEFQIREGVDGLVPCGTTGESPTLSHSEHKSVIRAAVSAAAGRVPVIAGTGSNSTGEAIELTMFAKKAGADACLSVVPYYNKPTQEGMYRHFSAIAARVSLPTVLYNIPGRCGASLAPKTVARLARIPSITAIKEATGSMDQASEILERCDLDVLCGDDSLTLPLLAIGAAGVISVFSNLFPAPLCRLVRAFKAGDPAAARDAHREIFPLCRALFIETNPIPLKTAMKIMKRDTGELRLPLCPMAAENAAVLKEALRRFRDRR